MLKAALHDWVSILNEIPSNRQKPKTTSPLHHGENPSKPAAWSLPSNKCVFLSTVFIVQESLFFICFFVSSAGYKHHIENIFS